MPPIDKKDLSETDICDKFITPAIENVGWDQMKQIRREVTLAPGPIIVRGNVSYRNKKKKKFADYVLSWEPGVPLAVVGKIDAPQQLRTGNRRFSRYRLFNNASAP